MARSASVSENLSQLSHVVNRTSNHSRHRSQVSIATLEIDSESKVDSDVDPSDSNSDPKIDETDLMIDFAISKKVGFGGWVGGCVWVGVWVRACVLARVFSDSYCRICSRRLSNNR